MISNRIVRRAVIAFLVAITWTNPARGATEDVAEIRASLEQAVAVYATDPERARELAGDAFLRFETSGVDRLLAARDPAAYRSLESGWLRLVSTMRSGAPATEIESLGRSLIAGLDAAAASPSAATGSLFGNALVIILREGFEAILILSALATTLRASGHERGIKPLGAGVVVALAASLVTAALAHRAGGFGLGREALEGVTCLVAVVVLFITSYWLISRAEGRRWQAYIRDSANRAMAQNRRGGLFLLAFVVVYREGFETVLFFQALAAEAGVDGRGALAGGFAVGAILLVVLYTAIARFGLRVPVQQFFAITGALLYVLAIRFAGAGVRELEEAGWLESSRVSWMPEIPWLAQWLGITPDRNALVLQALLGGAVLVGLVISRLRSGTGAAHTARHAA